LSWLTDAALEQAGRQKLIPWEAEDRRLWLTRRRRGIGGSDAPIVMGLSKYKTPHWLWNNKLGVVPDGDMTEPQLLGLVLEGPLLQLYQLRTGVEVKRVKEFIAHPVTPYRYCNPDGAAPDRLVQVKNAGSYAGWGPDGSDQIPDDYYVQVQHEMDCCSAELCDVPVLLGGSSFRIYTVPFNPVLAEKIAEAQEKFWDMVQRRVPPPIDYAHDCTRGYIDELFPSKRGVTVTVEADDLAVGWVAAYLKAKEAERETEARLCELRNRIIVRMGEGDRLALPNGTRVNRKPFRVFPKDE
jgi:putative phage-type endonuclease